MLFFARLLAFLAPFVLTLNAASASANHYGLIISSDSTYNVSFNNGVFTATGDRAILNVTDLANALADGNTEVTTDDGYGGDEKGDLHVESALSWTSSAGLTLDAFHSIFVDQAVMDGDAGGLTLTNNDGGTGGVLSFGAEGRVTFASLSSVLVIDSSAYTLVNSVRSLAAGVEADASGDYALAAAYDASKDGTYGLSPIPTTLTGRVEGLGNAISNVEISAKEYDGTMGFFAQVEGRVSDMKLIRLSIDVRGENDTVGGLVGNNEGILSGNAIEGTVRGGKRTRDGLAYVGGAVGVNSGTILNSHTRVAVSGKSGSWVGGLVGYLVRGVIRNSYSTGAVTAPDSESVGGLVGLTGHIGGSIAGGLVGANNCNGSNNCGQVVDSYAIGGVVGDTDIGGLIGDDFSCDGGVRHAYSTGSVSQNNGGYTGGFAGVVGCNTSRDDYWDTTTSGTQTGVGSGYSSGVTGLTTTQLSSGLPAGFDASVWRENPSINDGLPYLIDNPPPD